ncbi:MAG: DUF302 domain-containing protein [Thermoplasmata archaeon]|nr:DUF302 domain-containing protein [Thermoplasmata archaeon]
MESPTYDRISRQGVEETVTRLGAELKRRGFGVLSTIRIHDILLEKTETVVEPIVLLDVCSPRHALAALGVSRDVAILLPCKLEVSSEEGRTRITLQRPTRLIGAFLPEPKLERMGSEIEQSLKEAVDACAEA